MNMIRKIQLVTLLFAFVQISFTQSIDSSVNIVVHTVEKGQTIYSIAREYKLKPDDIRKQNPSIDDTFAIKPGQILRIAIPKGKEENESFEKLVKKPIFHYVTEQQTLYSISKMYNVSIDDLKLWNHLTNNSIGLGQELVIGWKFSSDNEQKPRLEPVQPQIDDNTIHLEQKTDQAIAPQKTVQRKTNFSSSKQQLLSERFQSDTQGQPTKNKKGVSIWFSSGNKMMNSAYYGLFSHVPVGSVVRVTNLMNKRVVFIKVIGSLPNTSENTGALIKLTPAARRVLGTTDKKARVRVDYVK